MATTFQYYFKGLTGIMYPVELNFDMTFRDIKEKIIKHKGYDITIDNMSIIKAGKLVSDNDTVEQHKDILQMATVYVVFKV